MIEMRWVNRRVDVEWDEDSRPTAYKIMQVLQSRRHFAPNEIRNNFQHWTEWQDVPVVEEEE